MWVGVGGRAPPTGPPPLTLRQLRSAPARPAACALTEMAEQYIFIKTQNVTTVFLVH